MTNETWKQKAFPLTFGSVSHIKSTRLKIIPRVEPDIYTRVILAKRAIDECNSQSGQTKDDNQRHAQVLRMLCTVYIGNVDYEVAYEVLLEICRTFGTVIRFEKSNSLSTNNPISSSRTSHFHFVEFSLPEAAVLAIENLDGLFVGNRPVRVRRPTNVLNDKSVIAELIRSNSRQNSIYCSNIHASLNTKDLESLFEPFGTVTNCKLLHKDTKEHLGFAVVEFSDSLSVRVALSNLNNFTLCDRVLRVGPAITPLSMLSDMTFLHRKPSNVGTSTVLSLQTLTTAQVIAQNIVTEGAKRKKLQASQQQRSQLADSTNPPASSGITSESVSDNKSYNNVPPPSSLDANSRSSRMSTAFCTKKIPVLLSTSQSQKLSATVPKNIPVLLSKSAKVPMPPLLRKTVPLTTSVPVKIPAVASNRPALLATPNLPLSNSTIPPIPNIFVNSVIGASGYEEKTSSSKVSQGPPSDSRSINSVSGFALVSSYDETLSTSDFQQQSKARNLKRNHDNEASKLRTSSSTHTKRSHSRDLNLHEHEIHDEELEYKHVIIKKKPRIRGEAVSSLSPPPIPPSEIDADSRYLSRSRIYRTQNDNLDSGSERIIENSLLRYRQDESDYESANRRHRNLDENHLQVNAPFFVEDENVDSSLHDGRSDSEERNLQRLYMQKGGSVVGKCNWFAKSDETDHRPVSFTWNLEKKETESQRPVLQLKDKTVFCETSFSEHDEEAMDEEDDFLDDEVSEKKCVIHESDRTTLCLHSSHSEFEKREDYGYPATNSYSTDKRLLRHEDDFYIKNNYYPVEMDTSDVREPHFENSESYSGHSKDLRFRNEMSLESEEYEHDHSRFDSRTDPRCDYVDAQHKSDRNIKPRFSENVVSPDRDNFYSSHSTSQPKVVEYGHEYVSYDDGYSSGRYDSYSDGGRRRSPKLKDEIYDTSVLKGEFAEHDNNAFESPHQFRNKFEAEHARNLKKSENDDSNTVASRYSNSGGQSRHKSTSIFSGMQQQGGSQNVSLYSSRSGGGSHSAFGQSSHLNSTDDTVAYDSKGSFLSSSVADQISRRTLTNPCNEPCTGSVFNRNVGKKRVLGVEPDYETLLSSSEYWE